MLSQGVRSLRLHKPPVLEGQRRTFLSYVQGHSLHLRKDACTYFYKRYMDCSCCISVNKILAL
jgi:hypothetical protein